jgi:hypothetical protein
MEYRYMIALGTEDIKFIYMPATHMYQLVALNLRLQKEITKLTADVLPELDEFIADVDDIHIYAAGAGVCEIYSGLEYLNELEKLFMDIDEREYPIVSLLTEIRALQAQLEQFFEGDTNGLVH